MNDIIELINLKEVDVERCELISLPNCNQKLIDLKLKRKHIYCPSCNQDYLYIDSYRTRIIKHPILKGINCKIRYACRRYKCKICGHSWKTSVNNRTNGTSCPVCANTKRANKHSICVNSENIVANHPNLMAEWSPKNTINPSTTSVFSHKKALWQCVCGHEWEAEIKSRFMGNKCPYCANRKILIGFNDLATTHPELALEWDYESNTEITPKELTRGSGKKVWWKCKFCGLHWQASVLNRVSGTGCPNCQSRRKK